MNLDKYIANFEKGAFSFQELKEIAKNISISTIFRLYSSYGKAKTIKFYNDDSLEWILLYLERELRLAGFDRAASLIKIDVDESFSRFFSQFTQLNQSDVREKNTNLELTKSQDIELCT